MENHFFPQIYAIYCNDDWIRTNKLMIAKWNNKKTKVTHHSNVIKIIYSTTRNHFFSQQKKHILNLKFMSTGFAVGSAAPTNFRPVLQIKEKNRKRRSVWSRGTVALAQKGEQKKVPRGEFILLKQYPKIKQESTKLLKKSLALALRSDGTKSVEQKKIIISWKGKM
jgi:hypothetical protein